VCRYNLTVMLGHILMFVCVFFSLGFSMVRKHTFCVDSFAFSQCLYDLILRCLGTVNVAFLFLENLKVIR